MEEGWVRGVGSVLLETKIETSRLKSTFSSKEANM